MEVVSPPTLWGGYRDPNPHGQMQWCYTEEGLAGPLASPPLSPDGCPILEYASFLPNLDSFKLEDDLCSTQQAPRRHWNVPLPLQRQHSHEMQLIVDSAFADMDAALESQADQRVSSVSRPWTSSRLFLGLQHAAVADAAGSLVTPNEEEQEWLDEQMAVADVGAMEMQSEDDFVQSMMESHQLDEEEARWLFCRQNSLSPSSRQPQPGGHVDAG